MSRLATAVLALLLTPLLASPAAAAMVAKAVDYAAGDTALAGTLVYDDAITTARPALLMVPNWYGVNAAAIKKAEAIAGKDYVIFLADMYGKDLRPRNAAEAGTAVKPLYTDRALMRARVNAGLAALRAHAHEAPIDLSRIAAIGFCFGGQVALEYARSGANMRAVIGFHSRLATRYPERSGAISAKVLICLGDADRFVSRAEREHFLNDMRANGVDCQMLLFSGVNHSFTDRYAEVSGVPGLKYDARADGRAWAAMQALLAEAFADTPQA